MLSGSSYINCWDEVGVFKDVAILIEPNILFEAGMLELMLGLSLPE